MLRKEDLKSEYKNMRTLEEVYANTKAVFLKGRLDSIKRKIRRFYKSDTRHREFDWHYSLGGETRWRKEFIEFCTPEELKILNRIYDLEPCQNYGQFETESTRAFNVAGKCVYYVFQRRIG